MAAQSVLHPERECRLYLAEGTSQIERSNPARFHNFTRYRNVRSLFGVGSGTFLSGLPGSALTLIEAEVCELFAPPLEPSVHRRNIVARGIDLNDLVGRECMVGAVRCRGMLLCEVI